MNKTKKELMYDKFLNAEELDEDEVLELGFTDDDIRKMVESGILKNTKSGYYGLSDLSGLVLYAKTLFKIKKYSEGADVLRYCLKMAPGDVNVNVNVNTLLLYNALYAKDFEQVYKCLEVLLESENSNEFCRREYNLWLFLLSFIIDIPEKYRDKVKNMKFEDVAVMFNDLRYGDHQEENKLRGAIINRAYSVAMGILYNSHRDSGLYSAITGRLCTLARAVHRNRQNNILHLVIDSEYDELVAFLNQINDYHGLSVTEQAVFCLVKDLLRVINEKKIPVVEESESDDFMSLVFKRDYKNARKNHGENKDRNSNKAITILLDKINWEIEKLELDRAVKEESVATSDVAMGDEKPKDESYTFSEIMAHLMNWDVDNAFRSLDDYLNKIGKLQFRGFVVDLIKLSLLEKDMAFVDPMHALSRIARNDYQFDVSVYIQDFYFSLIGRNYKKAAIYLDIISMSEAVGGIAIDTADMRKVLDDEMKAFGVSRDSLVISLPKPTEKKIGDVPSFDVKFVVDEGSIEIPSIDVVPVEEVSSVISAPVEKVLSVIPDGSEQAQSSVEELTSTENVLDDSDVVEDEKDIVYSLVDVIDRILDDTNVLMLEPMSSSEIDAVLRTTRTFDKIQTKIIEDSNGDKHIVLRYVDVNGPYVDIPSTLREANKKFNNWEYNEAIDLYQSVLPKLDTPKSFIYARLGFSYERTTYDGDYSKAIDYLTLAQVQSAKEDEPRDYTAVIEKLKKKSGYNGVRVTTDGDTFETKSGVPQLKKI